MKTSNAPRPATRILRFSPRTLRQIQQAVSIALLLGAGVMSFALLIQRWEAMTDAEAPAGRVDGDRLIDFGGRDADAWSDYWLSVGEAAGIG